MSTKFTNTEVLAARKYWGNLTYIDLFGFWKHYTIGAGVGFYDGLDPKTSFRDYLCISAYQSSYERANDI